MPELSFSEVEEILQLLQAIDGEDVKLQYGDLTIHVKRGGAAIGGAATGTTDVGDVSQDATTPAGQTEPAAPQPSQTSVPDSSDTASDLGESSSLDETPDHWVAVSAPMAGTFYRGSSPSEPPFVEVGDKVSAGDTVALIEVMKLYAELKTDVSGTVTRIDAPDASLVGFETALIWIDAA